jgi:CRISPR-associated protein Cmr6
MTKAVRQAVSSLCAAQSFSHAGLGLHRYLKEAGKQGEDNASKTLLLDAAVKSKASPAYHKAFESWKEREIPGAVLEFTAAAAGPLAVGLGGETPLEVGLTLHHTYGMPLVPGSSLKGLMRAACREAGFTEEERLLFGEMKTAGAAAFFDAWYDPSTVDSCPFHRDVVTVHHPDYYSSKGEKAFPTDFDDPNPVPFLVVKPGAGFLFRICLPNESWREFVYGMAEFALTQMGAGAKTNAGYGRFKELKAKQPPLPPPQEVVWRGVQVERSLPVAFTIDSPNGRLPVEGNLANQINNAFSKQFRARLKKRKQFMADVTAELSNGRYIIKSIHPLEES